MNKLLRSVFAGSAMLGAAASVALLSGQSAKAAPCVTTALSSIAPTYVCQIGNTEFSFDNTIDDFGGLGDLVFTQLGDVYTVDITNFGSLVNPNTAFSFGLSAIDPAFQFVGATRNNTVLPGFTSTVDIFDTTPLLPFVSGAASSDFQGTGTLTTMTFTFTQTPGPLPILGAGAAFGFSRKLRKRIKQSA